MKEKSEFEKRKAEKQVSLLTEALTSAVDAKGHWLNASGKLYPKLYPKGFSVSPFNALVLALDSDAKGCKSNLFTQFSEAKARGESVREHEKGVPFLYYNWNKYVNRNNPDDVITKEAYAELSEQDKQQYKGVKNREIRVLFNIDQTLLPMANETAYTTALKKDGTVEDRGYGDKEDKQLHGCVNGFLQKMKDNLVNVRQDGTGVAHYDTEKDVIYLPRQRDFEHYNDYVQEMMRQLVSATGHQQRLAREGMVMKNGKAPSEDAVKKEKLITELASGVKMLELGLPARLSKDSLGMVNYWTRELKEDPCLIDAIESEVNGALKVLKKAELGEKVEYATDQHQRETAQIQVQLPNHYFVADEIKQHPNEEQRTVVIVRDDASKSADVVLPQGASLEVNNEIKGMNKQRFTNALQKEGYDNVRFYNPDGALQLRRLDAAERIHRRTADFAGFALDLLAALDGFAVGVEETARQVVRNAQLRGFAVENYLRIGGNTLRARENLQSHLVAHNLHHLGQLAAYGGQLVITHAFGTQRHGRLGNVFNLGIYLLKCSCCHTAPYLDSFSLTVFSI